MGTELDRGAASRRGHPRVLAAVIVPPHLTVSGGARAAEQLSAALAPHCEITVASMMNGAGAGLDPAGAAPRRLGVRSWLPPVLSWSRVPSRYATPFYRSDIPRLLRAGTYDLLHLHNPMPALEFARVARTARTAAIPYVISTHGFNEIANGARIYGFDALRALAWQRLVVEPVSRTVRGAAGIFALSPADLDIVGAMGFRGEVRIVPNGVPLPARPAPGADARALASVGIAAPLAQAPLRCLFLANHTPNKGLPDLLEAFSRLAMPFTLVVGGERRDGIDYARHIRACRPGQRIIVTGRLSDAEVGALFRWASLFVFPTLADTFPLVVLEAMSHGVPVLATRVGGIPHQIAGGCGELVPPGDTGALVAAVERLARDPHGLAEMGRRARRRVAEEFSWGRAAELALEGYRAALLRPQEDPRTRARQERACAV